MEKQDWLLVLLALRDSSESLDPVRIQKGMFLLAQEGGLPEREQYSFRAYDYGPLSSEIYGDIEDLVAAGLIQTLSSAGYSWSRYRVTEEGLSTASTLLQRLPKESRPAVVHLAGIKQDVLQQRDFAGLLHYVYAKYPDYAKNSVFRG